MSRILTARDGDVIATRNGVPKKGRFEIVHPNGSINRFLNGNLHHETLPALDYYDGTKEWFHHGKMHRIDGPAQITPDSQSWWYNGKLHRTDGPAAIYNDGWQGWYLHGEQIQDPEEFRKILGMTKEQLTFLIIKWNWSTKA